VQIVIDFLGAHGPFPRTRERDPDVSEWIEVKPPSENPATG